MTQRDDAFTILREAWLQGRAVIPLFGAGISVPAGIPLTRQLVDYLVKIHWYSNIRGFTSPYEYILKCDWPSRHQLNVDLREVWKCDAKADRTAVAWEAELAKQRKQATDAALLATVERLISDLKRERRFHERLKMLLGQNWRITRDANETTFTANWVTLLHYVAGGDEHLVDAFFARLVRNRQPHGGHQFAAYLTKLQNWRLILTTNFDDLVETALRTEGLSPVVYEFITDDIPAARLVQSHLSVLKLHGGAFHLRAGFNLAEPVDESQQASFAEYVPDDSVMFVLGYSGADQRVLSLVDGLAGKLSHLIWVHRRSAEGPNLDESRWNGRLIPTAYDDGALFLQELYTRSTLSYPASRSHYRILRPIPEVPASDSGLSRDLPQMAPVDTFKTLVLLHSFADGQALRQEMLRVCQSYERQGFQRLWFNLYEFSSLDTFLSVLVEDLRRLDTALPLLMLCPETDIDRWYRWITEALRRSKYMIGIDGVRAFDNHHPARVERTRVAESAFRALVRKLAEHSQGFGESVVIVSTIGEFEHQHCDLPSVAATRVGGEISRLTDWDGEAARAWEESSEPERELLVVAAAFRRPRGIVGLARLAAKRLRDRGHWWADVTLDQNQVKDAERSHGERAPQYLAVEKLVEGLVARQILLRQEGGFYSMNPELRNSLYKRIRRDQIVDLRALHHDIADYYRVTMYEQSKDFYAYVSHVFHRMTAAVGADAERQFNWFARSLDRERDYVIGRGHASALFDVLNSVEGNIKNRLREDVNAKSLIRRLQKMRHLVLRSVTRYGECLAGLDVLLASTPPANSSRFEDSQQALAQVPAAQLSSLAPQLLDLAEMWSEVAELTTARQVVTTDDSVKEARRILHWCHESILVRLSGTPDGADGGSVATRTRMQRATVLSDLMDLELRGIDPWEPASRDDLIERYRRVKEYIRSGDRPPTRW